MQAEVEVPSKYTQLILESDKFMFMQCHQKVCELLGQAKQALEEEEDKEVDNDFNARAALLAIHSGQGEEALKLTEMVNLTSPGTLLIHAVRGWSLKEIGYEKRANSLFNFVLDMVSHTDSIMDSFGAAISSQLLGNELGLFFYNQVIGQYDNLQDEQSKQLNKLWFIQSLLKKYDLVHEGNEKRECLLRVLHLTDSSVSAYIKLGDEFFRMNNWDLSLQCYMRSIELNLEGQWFRHLRSSLLLLGTGNFCSAIGLLIATLEWSQETRDYYRVMVQVVAMHDSNESNISLGDRLEVIGLLFFYSHYYESSSIVLKAAIKIKGFNYKLYIVLYMALRKLKKYVEAIQVLESIRLISQKKKKQNESLQDCFVIPQIQENDFHFEQISIIEEVKEPTLNEFSDQKAEINNLESHSTQKNNDKIDISSIINENNNEEELDQQNLQQISGISSSDEDISNINLLALLADLNSQINSNIRAEQLYKTVIQLQPNNIQPLYKYVKFLNKQNRLEDSLIIIQQAIELEPQKIKLLIMKALIYSSLKRLQEAYQTYQQVLMINNNLQSTKFQLSQINYVLRKYQLSFEQMMNIKSGQVGYQKSINLLIKLFISQPSQLTEEQKEFANKQLRQNLKQHLMTLGDTQERIYSNKQSQNVKCNHKHKKVVEDEIQEEAEEVENKKNSIIKSAESISTRSMKSKKKIFSAKKKSLQKQIELIQKGSSEEQNKKEIEIEEDKQQKIKKVKVQSVEVEQEEEEEEKEREENILSKKNTYSKQDNENFLEQGILFLKINQQKQEQKMQLVEECENSIDDEDESDESCSECSSQSCSSSQKQIRMEQEQEEFEIYKQLDDDPMDSDEELDELENNLHMPIAEELSLVDFCVQVMQDQENNEDNDKSREDQIEGANEPQDKEKNQNNKIEKLREFIVANSFPALNGFEFFLMEENSGMHNQLKKMRQSLYAKDIHSTLLSSQLSQLKPLEDDDLSSSDNKYLLGETNPADNNSKDELFTQLSTGLINEFLKNKQLEENKVEGKNNKDSKKGKKRENKTKDKNKKMYSVINYSCKQMEKISKDENEDLKQEKGENTNKKEVEEAIHNNSNQQEEEGKKISLQKGKFNNKKLQSQNKNKKNSSKITNHEEKEENQPSTRSKKSNPICHKGIKKLKNKQSKQQDSENNIKNCYGDDFAANDTEDKDESIATSKSISQCSKESKQTTKIVNSNSTKPKQDKKKKVGKKEIGSIEATQKKILEDLECDGVKTRSMSVIQKQRVSHSKKVVNNLVDCSNRNLNKNNGTIETNTSNNRNTNSSSNRRQQRIKQKKSELKYQQQHVNENFDEKDDSSEGSRQRNNFKRTVSKTKNIRKQPPKIHLPQQQRNQHNTNQNSLPTKLISKQ